ncbi:pyrroline-5-carboxylate reductase [Methylophilaceae bacterium]|nr:pyrroline-5-carboxylate reductase [Methylophilaceae bacterium]|tara:strand:+ start:438 stop:1319 length:882 start_codon:yes stop_codon:yes gene_type:complete
MAKRKKRDFYFFGFGNMAQAIYQRMDKEAYGKIYVIEKSDEVIVELKKARGVNSKSEDFKLSRNTIIVEDQEYFYMSNFDIFLIAVKPSDIEALCKTQLTKELFDMEEQPFIISIAAGVTTGTIAKYLGGYGAGKLIRAMPNLCAKKGMAMTGLYGDPYYFESGTSSEGKLISEIFKSIGQVLWVDKESELDSITAISGSGPAYIYYIMNAMIEAAQELGLEKSVAQKLVAQTIIGAGDTGKDINDLGYEIIKVSSNGGTTEKAIDIFKQKKLDIIIKQAVKAAHKRSKELSK